MYIPENHTHRELFESKLSQLQTDLQKINYTEFQFILDKSISLIVNCLKSNLPLLVCGNGGSAADSQHIAGELVGKFRKQRRALNVRSLSTDTSVITAWANDSSYETVFARQVEAYSADGGLLLGISTSGNSKNVVLAAQAARLSGMKVISLVGEGGGELAKYSDIVISAPSTDTPRIQEIHTIVYHYLCEQIEKHF